jgi:hypothetical protein
MACVRCVVGARAKKTMGIEMWIRVHVLIELFSHLMGRENGVITVSYLRIEI